MTDNTSRGADDTSRGVDAEESPAESPFAELYDRAVESLLDVDVSDAWVDTRAGRTHLLTAGDPDAQPVVLFQGSTLTNPVTLSWVQALADEYRILAPDTPGQAGKSVAHPPAEYGAWVLDLLDGLDLDRPATVGVSHGGGVVLEAAARAPDRIGPASLVVPSGFRTAPSPNLARIIGPSFGYRLLGQRALLTGALAPMFTQSVRAVDPVVVDTIGKAIREDALPGEFPGPDGRNALADFDAPALVITGERDPVFPGRRTCRRARRDLPSLVDAVNLPGERHYLSPAGQDRTTERIRTFLAEHGEIG